MGKRLWAAAFGLAPFAFLALSRCALIFPVGGLDRGSDPAEAGSNLVEGGGGDASIDAPPDGDSGGILDAAQEVADDGSGMTDVPGLDAPDAPLSEAGPDSSGSCADGSAGPTGEVAFTFGSIEETRPWSVDPAANATIAWTLSDGLTCPGTLTMLVNFTGFGSDQTGLEVNNVSESWSSTTSRLHAWVKLQPQVDGGAAPFATLGTVGIFIRSHASTNYTFVVANVNPSFADGGWHELVLDLSAPDGGAPGRTGLDVDRTDVNAFGVFVSAATVRPPGAPAVPPPVRLLLDDVWLE